MFLKRFHQNLELSHPPKKVDVPLREQPAFLDVMISMNLTFEVLVDKYASLKSSGNWTNVMIWKKANSLDNVSWI